MTKRAATRRETSAREKPPKTTQKRKEAERPGGAFAAGPLAIRPAFPFRCRLSIAAFYGLIYDFLFVLLCTFSGKERMEDKKILLDNIDKLHTTEMGVDRIRKKLKVDTADVVGYCKNKVLDKNCKINKQGKNW